MEDARRPDAEPGSGQRVAFLGRWTVLLAVIVLVVAARELHSAGLLAPERIRAYVDDRPLLTASAFVLLYGACVVALIPTLPLNLAAGFLWGWLAGGLLATLGVTLGAVLAFAAARFVLGRATIARLVARLPFDMDKAIGRLDWRAVAFFRLNPAFPTSLINYALGITPLPLATYCWATFVFLMPATFAVAIIGEQTQSFVLGGTAADVMSGLTISLVVITTLMATAWFMRPAGHKAPDE